MVAMGSSSSVSLIVYLFAFAFTSRQLVHAVITTAGIEIQPTSTIPASGAVATGSEPILAVPVTAVYNPVLPSNASLQQYLEYDESLFTSPWTISVEVSSTDSEIDSRLSVSWPAGQGPSPTLPSSETHWDVCVVYFADLFQRFDVQGMTGNNTCFGLIGLKCIHYLTVQVQSGDFLKAGCSGLVEIPIPESCSSIYTDLITVNLTTFTSSTLESSKPFIGITDSFNSTNRSAVLSNAMQRTWPIMVVEIRNNSSHPGPIFSPVGCVQAINSTSNSTTEGTPSAGSGTTSSPATSTTSMTAGSSTATSSATSCRELEMTGWSFGLLAILLASILAC